MFKLPSKEEMVKNRWLRWLGPSLSHPSLWRWQRHSVALGVGIGIFFGFLVPIAQIPLSAVCAVLFRANISVAAVSTLVTNPFTFPGIYYAAYQVGNLFISENVNNEIQTSTIVEVSSSWTDTLLNSGKPLLIGLVTFAVVFGISSYFFTSLIWSLRTRIRWIKRGKRRVKLCKTS